MSALSLPELDAQLCIRLAGLRAHIDRKGRGDLSELEQLLWRCGERLDRALYERIQAEKLAAADIETATQKAERNEVDFLQTRAQLHDWFVVATRHNAPTHPLLFDGWLTNQLNPENALVVQPHQHRTSQQRSQP